MNQNLEDKIIEDFPWFEAKNVWTGEELGYAVGCECGDGWYDLIYNCCKEIDELYNSKNANINNLRIYQIKEKYGTLQIYLGNYIDGVNEIIDKYEKSSCRICEICGDRGRLEVKGGWIKTLCEKHKNNF